MIVITILTEAEGDGMQQGWIKLHRSLLDNFLWHEKRRFSKAEAWVDILLRANFAKGTMLINGVKLNLEPGQFATTIVHLSERWGWSRTKVSSFLNTLVQEQMISIEKTSKYTLLTIVKWGFYQQDEQEKSIKKTLKEQQKDNKKTQKKNDKNNKNVNNTPLTPQGEAALENGFDAFWETYPKKIGKEAARKAWMRAHPDQALFDKIMQAIADAKASEQWRKDNGQYIPNPATWLNQGRWDDELTIKETKQEEEKTHEQIVQDAQGAWGSIGDWY